MQKLTDQDGNAAHLDLSRADSVTSKPNPVNDGKYPATPPTSTGTLIHLNSGVSVHVVEPIDEVMRLVTRAKDEADAKAEHKAATPKKK